MNEHLYRYSGPRFELNGIIPTTYQPEYFDKEIELESELFYDLRLRNNILPFRLSDTPRNELDKIKQFFDDNKKSFFFIFNGSELVGSILTINNYIQSLSISKKYQRQKYGENLIKYAINFIYNNKYDYIELKILNGNIAAQSLYKKIGFKEILEKES